MLNKIKILIPKKLQSFFKKTFIRVFYFGKRYQCPFCKSHLRKLLPAGLSFPVLKEKEVVGGGFRVNARCPICGSFDRERLLYLFLLHKTNVFNNALRLLHVAPETKISSVLMQKGKIDYLTADINPDGVMLRVDITKIQFPDNSFDFIICNHVLEHVVDDARAMKEIHRILKPGGQAILQVPISLLLKKTYEDFSLTAPRERENAFGQADHVRIYGSDYKVRLEKAGFKVEVFRWPSYGDRFNNSRNRFCLNEKEPVYFVSKSDNCLGAGGK